MNLRTLFKPLILATALLSVGMAHAVQINLSKLRVNLESGQTSDFITVYNDSETDKETFEITLKKWEQSPDLKDVYADTEALFSSPKTIVLMPKQSKILRIMINDLPTAQKDYSHRLMVTQLPKKGEVAAPSNTINLLFRVTLPVFVHSEPIKTADKIQIEKSFVKEKGKNYLVIKNLDKQHIQLQELKFGSYDKKINHYLLQNSSDKIELPTDFKPEQISKTGMSIGTDKGTLKIE